MEAQPVTPAWLIEAISEGVHRAFDVDEIDVLSAIEAGVARGTREYLEAKDADDPDRP